MPEILLLDLIEAAMDIHGADGLWNGDGPCGCGRDDLNPGDCMSTSCVLAKSKAATEDDVDDCIEVGDVVWFPIQFKELPSTDVDGFRTVLLAERAAAKRDRLAMMADGIEVANQRDALAAEVVVLRTGTVQSPGAAELSYQWLRDGVPIAGATAPTYTVTEADAGAAVTLSIKEVGRAGPG